MLSGNDVADPLVLLGLEHARPRVLCCKGSDMATYTDLYISG